MPFDLIETWIASLEIDFDLHFYHKPQWTQYTHESKSTYIKKHDSTFHKMFHCIEARNGKYL